MTGFRRRQTLAGSAGVLLAGAAAGCGALPRFGVRRADGRWSSLAGLTTPRDDFGFAAVGQRLHAIGGMTGERGRALDAVEAFDPAAEAWSRGVKLPVALSSLRAAATGGRLLVAGGAREDGEVAQAWALDPGAGSAARWEPIAPLRAARLGHGLAAAGEYVYAAGGLAAGEPMTAVERYDARRDVWVPAAPLPNPRFNLGLVAASRRLYAIGGSGADRKPSTAVDVYDLEEDRWRPGPALPQPLSNFGAALLANRIHAVLHTLHYVLDLGTPQTGWQRLPAMPTSRHGLGLLALGGALYAAGGCSEAPQRDLSTLEVYRP